MDPTRNDGGNTDQAAYWSGAAGQKWVRFQDELDAILGAATERLIEHAEPKVGQRILDVGCGAGATTLAFAEAVGPTGSVVGLDIAPPLLARARERGAQAGLGNIEYLLADAQVHPFQPGEFDQVISRFGLMFFADPVAAFRNLATALRPNGRLAFVSWASISDNPWMTIARDAAVGVLGKPSPSPPRAPGPLAFAETDYVEGILASAGFVGCSAEQEQVDLVYPGDVAGAAHLASSVGPAPRIVQELGGGPEHVAEIVRRIATGFQPFATGNEVRVPARLNFFVASRP